MPVTSINGMDRIGSEPILPILSIHVNIAVENVELRLLKRT